MSNPADAYYSGYKYDFIIVQANWDSCLFWAM